jgi:hypothetical protein
MKRFNAMLDNYHTLTQSRLSIDCLYDGQVKEAVYKNLI